MLSISFSNAFSLSSINSNVTFFSGIIASKNLTVLNNTILINNATNSLNLSKATFSLTVYNIAMPYSAALTPIVLSTLTSSGYIKDSISYMFSANYNSFNSVSLVCNDYQIGINTLCTISANLKSNLNSLSFFIISLPNGFTMAFQNLLCPTNGTTSIFSNCTYYINNTIYVNNITTTNLVNNSKISI